MKHKMVMLPMHRYILTVALFLIIGINHACSNNMHAAPDKTNTITTPYKLHTDVPAMRDAESIGYGVALNDIGVSVHQLDNRLQHQSVMTFIESI